MIKNIHISFAWLTKVLNLPEGVLVASVRQEGTECLVITIADPAEKINANQIFALQTNESGANYLVLQEGSPAQLATKGEVEVASPVKEACSSSRPCCNSKKKCRSK